MNPPASSRTPAKPTRCRVVREWVQLGLGAAAGVTCIYLCFCPQGEFWRCGLLLFLSLTCFGHKTVLSHLVELLKTWQAGVKP